MIFGNTAVGTSAPAIPALHIPEPLSTTIAGALSSAITDEVEFWPVCVWRQYYVISPVTINKQNENKQLLLFLDP